MGQVTLVARAGTSPLVPDTLFQDLVNGWVIGCQLMISTRLTICTRVEMMGINMKGMRDLLWMIWVLITYCGWYGYWLLIVDGMGYGYWWLLWMRWDMDIDDLLWMRWHIGIDDLLWMGWDKGFDDLLWMRWDIGIDDLLWMGWDGRRGEERRGEERRGILFSVALATNNKH